MSTDQSKHVERLSFEVHDTDTEKTLDSTTKSTSITAIAGGLLCPITGLSSSFFPLRLFLSVMRYFSKRFICFFLLLCSLVFSVMITSVRCRGTMCALYMPASSINELQHKRLSFQTTELCVLWSVSVFVTTARY